MFWTRKLELGIDFGGHAVKLCSLSPSGADCRVAQETVLPERTSQEQTASDSAVAERLQKLLQRLQSPKLKNAHLSVALDDVALTSGYLEFPSLSEAQLEVAIPAAVAREIPRPLQEVGVFTVPVPPISLADKKGIFFVAVPHSVQESCRNRLSALSLQPTRAEPALFAQIRATTQNQDIPADRSWALIHSGFRWTSVTLMRGTAPYFSRTFRLAGSDFTYAFQMGDQVSWAQAERLKMNYNVAQRDFQVESFVQRWLQELRRSLSFAAQKIPSLKPARILMSGGNALWQGLCQRVSEELELPVDLQQWQRLKATASNEVSHLALFDVALGLVCHS